MGTSTDAYLLYGYDLGSEDDWKIQGLNEDGEWKPGWLDADDADGAEDDEPDWPSVVEERLLTSVGFTEKWTHVDAGYNDRRKAAEEQVGVELVSHCSSDYPMYVLAAKQIRARRGYPEMVDFAELGAAVDSEDLDGKLARALEALDIRPTQEKPAWLLCSDWG